MAKIASTLNSKIVIPASLQNIGHGLLVADDSSPRLAIRLRRIFAIYSRDSVFL